MNRVVDGGCCVLALAALLTAGIGCGIGVNPEISECGGFETVTRALDENPDCGDLSVTVAVDLDDSELVHFVNRGVWLNCCGEHGIDVRMEDDVYVVYESDEPEGLFGARCGCMCLFDFAVDIPGVEADRISLRVVLDVSDDDEPETIVWEGELDLTSGSATYVIAENVGWCDL